MTIARKDYRCDFCGEAIPKASEYFTQRITPWDHPDNEGFFTHRAHARCEEVWNLVGTSYDWEWDHGCESEWKEILAQHTEEMAR